MNAYQTVLSSLVEGSKKESSQTTYAPTAAALARLCDVLHKNGVISEEDVTFIALDRSREPATTSGFC